MKLLDPVLRLLGASVAAKISGALVRKTIQGLCASLGMFLLCLPLFSQGSSTGRILGAVTDQTGGAVAGATVSVLGHAKRHDANTHHRRRGRVQRAGVDSGYVYRQGGVQRFQGNPAREYRS